MATTTDLQVLKDLMAWARDEELTILAVDVGDISVGFAPPANTVLPPGDDLSDVRRDEIDSRPLTHAEAYARIEPMPGTTSEDFHEEDEET